MQQNMSKSDTYRIEISGDLEGLSRDEMLKSLNVLQMQTDKLLKQMKKKAAATVANDTLYRELEMRYGCGFAQWVVDRVSAG